MSTSIEHPWILTSPWYRWEDAKRADTGRMTRPELQMYGTPDYVNAFLAEPQRYLVPREDKDYVHRTTARAAVANQDPDTVWRPRVRRKTGIRKLFLPIHTRYYLVVVELHCDRPGLPRVGRDEVAEAGFVIRRLPVEADDATKRKAQAALGQIALVREQLGFKARAKTKAKTKALPRTSQPGLVKKALTSAADIVKARDLQRPVMVEQRMLLDRWTKNQVELKELVASQAITLEAEGWFPDEHDSMRGTWKTLSNATPERDLQGEHVFALRPLIPDPNDLDHTARDRTIYFGVIPAGAVEQDSTGAPRFDARHLYELRCFVRRRHERPECGMLVWSLPTQGYQLATAGDLDGTSNNPVTIEFPDLSELQARADELTTGGAGGVRVLTPPNSGLNFDNDETKGLGTLTKKAPRGFGSICFFAIILIFIIAFFLLLLFLPIVVFLFQLWFMLRLKFCIPPSLDIDLGLAVELKAQLDIALELEVDVDLSIKANLETDFETQFALLFPDPTQYAEIMKQPLSQRVQLYVDAATDFRDSLDPEIRAELGLDEIELNGEGPEGDLPGTGLLQRDYYEITPWRKVFA